MDEIAEETLDIIGLEALSDKKEQAEEKEIVKDSTVIISTKQIDYFRELILLMSNINREARIEFHDDYIRITVMDGTKSYMAELTLFKTMFITLEKPEGDIIINLQELHGKMKSKAIESITLTVERDGELICHTKGKYNIKSNIPLLNELETPPRMKDVKFDVNIISKVDMFKEVLEEIKNLYANSKDMPTIKFVVRNKHLYASSSKDDKRWIEIDLKTEVDCKEFETKYCVEFLDKFMDINKLCDKTDVVFGNNMPILLKFVKQNFFVLKGVIAPRIKND